ncbi:hypothetical protein WR25_23482 [Diploscapter pachys]|uniref:Uncharacterized protein n=1 Tax=Diploscapter pachys TaxID=2018661 RepID=A0A2A2L9E1_9BILA|nr:hypothetical protein WR25_23482 [Diploscapter pachys]
MPMKDPDNVMVNHRSITGLVLRVRGRGENDGKMAGGAAQGHRRPEEGEWDAKNCSRRGEGKGRRTLRGERRLRPIPLPPAARPSRFLQPFFFGFSFYL